MAEFQALLIVLIVIRKWKKRRVLRKESTLNGSTNQFKALNSDKVETYLLHGPDLAIPIAETLEAVDIVYRQGRDLTFPILKKFGFTQILSYSPLVGGFLTKNPVDIAAPKANGRWDKGNITGRLYNLMYNKPSIIDAFKDDVVVIIRARTAEQPEGTLAELDEGPLDEALVSELDDLWEGIRHDAPVDRVFEIGQSKDVKISQDIVKFFHGRDRPCRSCGQQDWREFFRPSQTEEKLKPQPYTIEDFWVSSTYCPLCNLIFKAFYRHPDYIAVCKEKNPGWVCRVWSTFHKFYLDQKPGSARRMNTVHRLVPYLVPIGQTEHPKYASAVSIQVLANEMTSDVSETLFSGRLVDSSKVNVGLVKHWILACEQRHGLSCHSQRFEENPGYKFRLIDIRRKCIVTAPAGSVYLALSYNWGDPDKVKHLKLTKKSKNWLETEGKLSNESPEVPTTIKDAVSLVSELGERYLWVDALCIQQDDVSDRDSQIPNMDKIYSCAKLTIVAGTGSDAWAGLLGVGPDPSQRRNQQLFANINEMNVMTTLEDYHSWRNNCRWETRGWCLQEKVLSKRMLIIGNEQIFFSCKSELWSEDTISESFDSNIVYQSIELNNYIAKSPFSVYESLVFDFAHRNFTHPSDVLNAFLGIENYLRPSLSSEFFWGLPVSMLDLALAWTFPYHYPGRRRAGFPSWAWAGWDFSGTMASLHLTYPWKWTGVQGFVSWYRLSDYGLLPLANAETQAEEGSDQSKTASSKWLSQESVNDEFSISGSSSVSAFSIPKTHVLRFWTTFADLIVDREGPQWKHEVHGCIDGMHENQVYIVRGFQDAPIGRVNLDRTWRSKMPDRLGFIAICRHLKETEEGSDLSMWNA
ncbi:MAG: hypothetical protein Q9190_002096 [Brigantiaea leucoxantha]